MRNWLMRWGQRLSRFMYGRYGTDQLNLFLTVVCVVLLVLSGIRPLYVLMIPSAALLAWSTFRCYSRNIAKRRRENDRYLKLVRPVQMWFRLQRNRWRDRKTFCYFKCKHCRAVLRVPKGKGTIDVTCPRCQKITVKKT